MRIENSRIMEFEAVGFLYIGLCPCVLIGRFLSHSDCQLEALSFSLLYLPIGCLHLPRIASVAPFTLCFVFLLLVKNAIASVALNAIPCFNYWAFNLHEMGLIYEPLNNHSFRLHLLVVSLVISSVSG